MTHPIPQNRQTMKLSCYADIIMGQSPDGSTCNLKSIGIPLLNGPTEFGPSHPTPIQYTTDGKKFSKKGDLLFCVRGSTTGRMNWSDQVYALGRGLAAIRSKEGTNQFFVKAVIDFFLGRILQKSTGSTFPSIGKDELGNFSVHAFQAPEQRRIVAVLEAWEKAIEQMKRKIDLKRNVKNKLMQNLLTGKIRLPGFEDQWETVKLSDIFERVRRITKNTDFIKSYSISSKIGFELQEDKYSRVMSGSSLKKYTHLLKGEFSYNKGNSLTYPYGCIYVFEENEGLVPFVYISFRNLGKVDSEFYKQYFLHGLLEKQLKALITSGVRGNGLLNVAVKDFFQCTVPCPSIKEQTAIAQALATADKEIDLIERKLVILEQQKTYLLNNLITGRIRTPEKMPIPKS